jgi:hypothetical protein
MSDPVTCSDTDDVATRAGKLAEANGASMLAAALLVRLRADGREALATRITAALADELILPSPPPDHP